MVYFGFLTRIHWIVIYPGNKVIHYPPLAQLRHLSASWGEVLVSWNARHNKIMSRSPLINGTKSLENSESKADN